LEKVVDGQRYFFAGASTTFYLVNYQYVKERLTAGRSNDFAYLTIIDMAKL
jgi:hypothetical protein